MFCAFIDAVSESLWVAHEQYVSASLLATLSVTVCLKQTAGISFACMLVLHCQRE